MGFVMSVVVASALAASPPVFLDLEAGMPCALDETLPVSLMAQGIRVTGTASAARWVLSARAQAGAIDVRLGPTNTRRFTPTAADCPVLPRAVALLVRSWVEAAPAPAPRPAPAVARAVAVPEQKGALPSTSAPPPPPDAEPEVEPGQPPTARAFEPSLPGPRAARPKRSTLSVLLTGGGAIALADAPVGMARLAGEWGFREPWAFSADVGFHSLRGAGAAEGTVRASLQWAGVGVRRAFATQSSADVHLFASAQVIRIDAVATGFSARRRADVWTAGAHLGLEVRNPLFAGLSVLGRLTLQARVPQTFSIAGVGQVLSIPAWGVGLEAGLAWNFF